jgi:hypothetical protein
VFAEQKHGQAFWIRVGRAQEPHEGVIERKREALRLGVGAGVGVGELEQLPKQLAAEQRYSSVVGDWDRAHAHA